MENIIRNGVMISILSVCFVMIVLFIMYKPKKTNTQKQIKTTYFRKDGTFLIVKDTIKIMESFSDGTIKLY
jgi:hypothetical protein